MKTEAQVLRELAKACGMFASDAAAARSLGISRSHLCRVFQGKKPLTARVAATLGYQRVVAYVKVKP